MLLIQPVAVVIEAIARVGDYSIHRQCVKSVALL